MRETTEVQAGEKVRVYSPETTSVIKVILEGQGRAVLNYSGISTSLRVRSDQPWDAIVMVTDHIDVKNCSDSAILVSVTDEIQEPSS